MPIEAAIAVHRYGLGARPGEMAAASADPRGWLLAQLHNGADQPQPLDSEPLQSGAEITKRYIELVRARRDARMDGGSAKKDVDAFKEFLHEFLREMSARFALGFTTQKPFAERLVWFWSNHFAVSAQSAAVGLAGPFEREAIRPHIAGTFEDMLVASTKHPAMLVYLSNAQSIGPDSLAGLISGKGLNENLGREIMELHTLGVRSGYTQADVINFAKVITGWSVYPPRRFPERSGEFWFNERMHEPGAQIVLGKSYPENGFAQGRAVLEMLAYHPATAKHIATKLVRHFVADAPPADLVARLAKRFHDTGGDLMQVTRTLVTAPEAWTAPRTKLKKPGEWMMAAMRSSGLQIRDVRHLINTQNLLGEPLWRPPAPKGFSDNSAEWVDGLAERLDIANQTARLIGNGGSEPDAMVDSALGPLASAETRQTVRRAESRPQALALLLMSPEFQRR